MNKSFEINNNNVKNVLDKIFPNLKIINKRTRMIAYIFRPYFDCHPQNLNHHANILSL